ncbi:MAG: DUF3667 domain-containing protein [Polaribacter sp.]|uniref:DUF3667 domain-containing protein n=1 Tax=unclassified Polaribacter TaxID=196858 RepID=UPI0026106DDF|nr:MULTISPECIES: DUF3667 domain-containing protein [unclassified Polaribacter]MDG1194986.1 DUF3667 domain-containing protein [Polaribacter sp.]MDG1404493.1 DUF3667 domain-containing protein [Polaribacter sp.]
MHEVFNGFFNFDAKFWNTIIPLLIKPGKVSKEYVDGKRQRYSNPFQFYLTVSILFFLILGLSKNIDKFKELKNGTEQKQSKIISFDTDQAVKNVDIDSLKNAVNTELKNSWIPIDSVKRKKIIDQVAEKAKDSTKSISTTGNKIDFAGLPIADYLEFQKKHPKTSIDAALDSLQKEKTFFNRFLYNRAKVINSLTTEGESQEQFSNQLLSYISIALFVFLPFFTLFLKLFYIRRKYTYVDHLVLVFHTQTVFFMLLSIYFLLELFGATPQLWIFAVLFLMYLLIAMRKFYQQGYFKTFIKFTLLNFTYIFISIFGVVIVGLISFALF